MHDEYLTFIANCRVHNVMGLSRPEWELAGQPTFEDYKDDADDRRARAPEPVELPEFAP